ncbi:MAG TPA: hypothetical protein VGI64_23510 [Streptosporangiaceae bacterium]
MPNNFVRPKIKPLGWLVWTGDGSGQFKIHSWKYWSTWNAQGSATIYLRNGPLGTKPDTEPTTLHFYRVRIHNGHRYFTRLHFALHHRLDGVGSSTLSFCSRGTPAWYYSC